MGYIANVTTKFPDWMTPTMFVGEMMRTFFFQRHLLEYIADSEGLHAYSFRDSNGVSYADRQQTGNRPEQSSCVFAGSIAAIK